MSPLPDLRASIDALFMTNYVTASAAMPAAIMPWHLVAPIIHSSHVAAQARGKCLCREGGSVNQRVFATVFYIVTVRVQQHSVDKRRAA
jgi:hypothetical protein